MSCDVGEVTESLENQMSCDVGEVTESFPSLRLRHSSFSNPSLALPTSQLILQPFRCFTYVTAHSPAFLSLLLCHRFSLTSPGEPPMCATQTSPGVLTKHFLGAFDLLVRFYQCHVAIKTFSPQIHG